MTVTVTGVNDRPVAGDVAIGATEDGSLVNGSFIVTDADSSNTTHTFNILSSPSEGSVANNNDGTFTFDPGSDFQDLALGETRLVSFSYTATDSSGSASATSTTKTVTVTLTGVNDRPVAGDVAIGATEDSVGVNGNFIETDADSSDTHTFTLLSSPSEGSIVNNNDGTFTFDPGSDFQDLALGETRLVSFSYSATDSSGSASATSTTKTVTVTVTGVNDRPVAGDVTISATEDGTAVSGNFIATDSDSSDMHSFTLTSSPSEGSVVDNHDGTFSFDPGGDFQDLSAGQIRNVTFNYRVMDYSGAGDANSFEKTVMIAVIGVNDQVTLNSAVADQSTNEDGYFRFTFPSDTFIDVDENDELNYSARLIDGKDLPQWLSFDSQARTFSGTPLNADAGTITVNLTANDSRGSIPAIDTFDIVITNTNDAPSVSNLNSSISYTQSETTVALTDLVIVDVDVGEIITATLTLTNTSAGSLSENDGSSYDATTGIWTITGNTEAVNRALANLQFTPNAQNNTDTSIVVVIDDGDEDQSGPLVG